MRSYRGELGNARIGVWGFGREGRAVAQTAVASGAREVVVVDAAVAADATDLGPTVRLLSGDEYLTEFSTCDRVFVSPGVPWFHPAAVDLRASGVPISSATDLFLSAAADAVIGVTGTKGKSTTASFAAHVLSRLGVAAVAAGNIGLPLLDVPDDAGLTVVAEISSQQCAAIARSPRIAVVTNLGQDHLDWHGGVEEYVRAKARIFDRGAQILICEHQALRQLRELAGPAVDFPATVVTEDAITDRWPSIETIDPASTMRYPHNQPNGQLAVLAVEASLGRELTAAEILDALDSFTALPHRLEVVRRAAGKRWIDDTLATTADSVVVALTAMPADRPVAVIVGGMDRGISYRDLDDFLLAGSRSVDLIQIPSNGAKIGQGYAAARPARVHRAADLEDAVRLASGLDVDAVLLSPGAPSYDEYVNFEAKATAFVNAVDRL